MIYIAVFLYCVGALMMFLNICADVNRQGLQIKPASALFMTWTWPIAYPVVVLIAMVKQ